MVESTSLHPPYLSALPFFRRIFSDLLQSGDALLVLARGLGSRHLLVRFLRLYSTIGELVFVLNAGRAEAFVLQQLLEADGMPPASLPRVLDAATGALERRRAMDRGGVHFTSSQQLLVDLLSGRLDARRVKGVLVCGAHTVTDTTKEGFALRLLKEKHPGAFVKAVTEDPEALMGFGRLEKTMRALQVRKLLLWPRFSDLVRKDLDALPRLRGGGEETVDLTPGMAEVQRAIVACMDVALEEVKQGGHLNVETCTRTAALFDSFEDSVRGQLGGGKGGEGVPASVRGALYDMRMLRKLLMYLVRYDAVAFYSFLDMLRTASLAEKRKGDWILADRGGKVITAAKARVYKLVASEEAGKKQRVGGGGWVARAGARDVVCGAAAVLNTALPVAVNVRGGGEKEGERGRVTLEVVLEQQPKWERLLSILREVQTSAAAAAAAAATTKTTATAAPAASSLHLQPGNATLVFARDERTCMQLRDLLQRGGESLMREKFLSLLSRNSARSANVREGVLSRYRSVYEGGEGGGGGEEGGAPTPPLLWYHDPLFLSLSKDEKFLLLAADLLADPSPPTKGLLPIFVSSEQRLLWKQLAREYRQRQCSDAALHAELLREARGGGEWGDSRQRWRKGKGRMRVQAIPMPCWRKRLGLVSPVKRQRLRAFQWPLPRHHHQLAFYSASGSAAAMVVAVVRGVLLQGRMQKGVGRRGGRLRVTIGGWRRKKWRRERAVVVVVGKRPLGAAKRETHSIFLAITFPQQRSKQSVFLPCLELLPCSCARLLLAAAAVAVEGMTGWWWTSQKRRRKPPPLPLTGFYALIPL